MKLKIVMLLILFCTTQLMFFNPSIDELEVPSLKINALTNNYLLIDGDSQLNQTVQNKGWSGSGTINDPYIIEDLFFSSAIVVDGGKAASLTLKNTHQYTVIKNNSLKSATKHAGVGIYLIGSSNIAVMNNTIELYGEGLYIWDSENITIVGNTFFDNEDGSITFGSTTLLYKDNEFYNSSEYSFYIQNNTDVIFHSNYIKFCSNSPYRLTPNRFTNIKSLYFFNNTFENVYTTGVVVGESTGAEIVSNTLINCHNWDMHLYMLTSSNITRNQFIRTDGTIYSSQGNLYIRTSSMNTIYENNFHSFSGITKDIDPGNNDSLFSYNGRGNYYSNYFGSDNDNDSIGDTPYLLKTGVYDYYPLINPVDLLKPILKSHDSELTFKKDDRVVISWNATDANPNDFKVLDNNSLVKSGSWKVGPNEVDLGNLSLGIHIITIKLFDIDHNFVSFDVIIIVQDLDYITNTSLVPIDALTLINIISLWGMRRVRSRMRKRKTR